jgi:hypothetical protein
MTGQAGRAGWVSGRRRSRSVLAVLGVVGALAAPLGVAGVAQAASGVRVDLKVLLVDDGGGMVSALADTLTTEGVPHTTISLSDSARSTITAGYLSSGSEAFYQAVVLPNETGGGLGADELTALHTYEATYGIRQVDASTWSQPSLGLNWATYTGSTDGMIATVTDAGKADGWGYLSGAVPISTGSYGFLATPLSATSNPVMPAGATFTPLVTAPIPGTSDAGSLIGSFSSGGVEQLVITTNYNGGQLHLRTLAHGIVSWMTRGVHLGHNRNYFTMHYDDAFSADERWSTSAHCTPGEDCPAGTPATTDIRMSAADVSEVAAWVQANGYQPTLAFNGYYAVNDPATDQPYPTPDALTAALVANKGSFRWLNHGYKHIFQGCQQDFTVIPWRCVTTDGATAPAADGSNLAWTAQADVSSEITSNIAEGNTLGLPFDPKEYLSGEHSGLKTLPQMPVDNPNFGAALSANGITVIGADASRETGQRTVGSAVTIPRHPMAIYYNVSTRAEEVSEYNWFYAPASAGGNCTATATTTCMSGAIDPATGFTGYIVPTDTAWDLHFILSNDPRPFYAHVSNLTGPDYLGLTLMSSILDTYRVSFAANAPLVNLTQTQAAEAMGKQQAWSGATGAVTAYVQGSQVTITNPTSTAAPVTVPAGTTVNGAAFGESYGGELSGWVNGDQTLTVLGTPYAAGAPTVTSAATVAFAVNRPDTFTVTTTGTPTPAITATGTLPDGLTLTDNGDGTATLSGTPTTTGITPIALTATNSLGSGTQTLTITVGSVPTITSAASVTGASGTKLSFTVTTTGLPTAKLTETGALPKGITFKDNGNGTATVSGQPASGTGGVYKITLTATNAVGSGTQAFTFNVKKAPAFAVSSPLPTGTVGTAYTATIKTTGAPAPAITLTGGTLPAGLTFVDNGDGTGVISGTPAPGAGKVYSLTFKATNVVGSVSKAYSLTIRVKPVITGAVNTTLTRGKAATITVTVTGSPTPSYTVTGTVPTGMKLSKTTGKATISGTPTKAGASTLTVTATNTTGTTTAAFTITVV